MTGAEAGLAPALGALAGLAAGVLAAWTTPLDDAAAGDPKVLALRSRRAGLGAALATVGAVVGALLGALTGDLRGAAAGAILAPAVLAIADLDRRRGLIADAHSALVAAAGLLGAGALAPDLTVIDQALGLGLGLGVFAAVKVGVRMARGVDGLGGGDVLLAGAGGLWTGWLWFGPWVAIAAGATLAFAALTGRLAPGARIAFGPGLALGLPITVAVAAFAPI